MRTVLATGCGGGFGLLTARTPARKGDRVIATVREWAQAEAPAGLGSVRA
ncbi:hypothetical protein [Nonomuraea sp. NPDC002799]